MTQMLICAVHLGLNKLSLLEIQPEITVIKNFIFYSYYTIVRLII